MTHVLVVEDDPLISDFLARGLRASGFSVTVADDGRLAYRLGLNEEIDLVILDMGLPGEDGLQVLTELRRAGRTMPVIVLTGLPERDAATCLDQGADDYMRKPFDVGELIARIRTRLRPAGANASIRLTSGGLTLDLRTRRAEIDGRDVELTNREFALLESFMRRPDQVLTRELLLASAWGYNFDPSSNLVNVYVNILRRKLGDDVIETVRGAGYRLRGSRPRTEDQGTFTEA
jgi:DNA-binding response OmpR family regulator